MSCGVCASERVGEINQRMLSGESVASLGRTFGFSKDSLRRHKLGKHWPAPSEPDDGEQSYAPPANSETLSAVEFVRAIRGQIVILMSEARKQGDRSAANTASRNALHAAELLAKLEGLMQPAPTVNIATMNVTNSTFALVQTAILTALAPHPEAKAAVVEALERIEHEGGGAR
jgi:hypothetical protein